MEYGEETAGASPWQSKLPPVFSAFENLDPKVNCSEYIQNSVELRTPAMPFGLGADVLQGQDTLALKDGTGPEQAANIAKRCFLN